MNPWNFHFFNPAEPEPEPELEQSAHLTMTAQEEQRAREYLATHTIRFSIEEETAPHLETSHIQPTVLRPLTPQSSTDIATALHHTVSGLAAPTMVRSDSEVENVPIGPELVDVSPRESHLSGSSPAASPRSPMSAAFMEESMIRSPTPTPPILSPRSQAAESMTSPRALQSVLDRPIFGGMVFPSGNGSSEKRQLYLQEKMDRSRPTTPIKVVESPRKQSEEQGAIRTAEEPEVNKIFQRTMSKTSRKLPSKCWFVDHQKTNKFA